MEEKVRLDKTLAVHKYVYFHQLGYCHMMTDSYHPEIEGSPEGTYLWDVRANKLYRCTGPSKRTPIPEWEWVIRDYRKGRNQ